MQWKKSSDVVQDSGYFALWHRLNMRQFIQKMNGLTFATELEKLGYFSYASSNLEEAKDALIKSFDTDRSIITHEKWDRRIYACGDCEELFEGGGVPHLLDEMSTLFTALNIGMMYEEDNYAEALHSIIVNGRRYIMAQGSILMWGETFLRFAEMINQEFELQSIQERIYLLSYDDCQYMIFLTEGQHRFICDQVLPENSPLTTSAWEAVSTESLMKILNGE
jgi:hypothetical protein